MTARTRKSRSARASSHDWTSLLEIVGTDSLRHPTLDFEEHYVHAIQKALEGRDNAPLFKLLDSGRMLHPALMPALADVIRSQRDAARGRGKSLTRHQDRMIRDLYDRLGPEPTTEKWLAETFKTSMATIKRSLNETKPKAK